MFGRGDEDVVGRCIVTVDGCGEDEGFIILVEGELGY